MASIKQRGSAWRAQVKKDGRRWTATFDSQREAKAWAAQLESKLIEQGEIAKHTIPLKTLHQAFDRYLAEVAIHHKGFRWEQVRLQRIKRELPNVRLMDLAKGSLLSDWRNARLEVVSKASVRREMTLLRLVFEAARTEWKWIAANPLDEIKRPPNPPHRTRIISQHEIDLIVRHLGYSEGPPRTQKQCTALAFLFSLETAMRASEILNLHNDEIFLKRRVVRILDSKNGEAREVPLSSRAVELLGWAQASAKDGRPFAISPGVREQYFGRARADAGFATGRDGGFTFHDARATALTRLAKKLDVLELAKMVGHRDPRSLMIYFRAPIEDIALKLD